MVPQRLADVSLHIGRGEVLALVGPNGAGKSSLLDVLAGDLPPTRGRVQLLGRELNAFSRPELARLRGVLPQESAPVFAFTAREICALGRLPHVPSQAHNAGPMQGLIDAFELRPLLEVPFDRLSGGERQRAQLVRVLTQIEGVNDALLLLDEPMNQLDLRHQQTLIAVLRARAALGATIVVAVHDLNVALVLAHRVALLNRGRLVSVDVPEATLTVAAIRDVFGVDIAYVPNPHGALLQVLKGDGSAASSANR